MAHFLKPEHQELINASAITPEVAIARGYRTADDLSELAALGFMGDQCRPGLLIPIRGVDGDVVTHQLRPDDPRLDDRGRPRKYETPARSRLAIDVPTAAHPHLRDPKVELWVTEGARKVDSGVSNGIPCIVGLLGVSGWRGTNEFGGKTELADWSAIALNGREVVVAFDSDVATKASVRDAIDGLTAFLVRKQAHVRFALLPDGMEAA